MGEDSGEKTEEPTPHKLQEARKKGQAAKSKDLTAAFMLVVAFYALKASSEMMWVKMVDFMNQTYAIIPEPFSASVASTLLVEMMMVFGSALLPMFIANMLVALIVESLQTGFLLSFEAIEPDVSKLDMVEGMKKFFSLKQYVELIKSLLKMFVVIWIIYISITEEFYMVVISQQFTLWKLMSFTGEIVMKVVTRLSIFYFLIGVMDYFYQKYEFIKGLKMSKKEIKDEYKRLEGDPMIKQRQRDAQRKMSEGRQMGAVPGADVVVTNPVHLAVAIMYKTNKMRAPKVVAKGERITAETIKRIAEENDVPVVENKPLARALYKLTEVDQEVPPQYYKAVAEILAFVYNLRNKKKNRF